MVIGRTLLNAATGAVLLVGDLDPTSGSGITAPRGSVFVREGTTANQAWLKTGSAATAWTRLARADDLATTITPFTVSAAGGTLNIDLSQGSRVIVQMSGATTLQFSNPVAGEFYHLEMQQDATGGRTVAWPTGAGPRAVKFPGGTLPVLSVPGNAIDYITLWWEGTYFLGQLVGKAYA